MNIEQKYIEHVKDSFLKAWEGKSKITDEIKAIDGMTGEMTRHFYNNLLSMEGAVYLEIGCWKGSSSCAAMYGNKADIILMDNFSGFGGPKEEFMANYERHKGNNNVQFIEADCFKIDVSKFDKKFNIFLADADHSEMSQFKIITHYLSVMADIFILIIDDYNWLDVRLGTERAIAINNLNVIWSKEIRLTDDNQFTHDQQQAKETWWNGISVFVIKK